MANYTVINVKEFWTNKDFLDFSVKRFSRGLNEGHEVVLIGLELADGSLLMADRCKTGSRGAIKRLHSITSIFHLFKNNSIIRKFLTEIEEEGHTDPSD